METRPDVLARTYPGATDQLPGAEVRGGRYLVRFARSPEDLTAIQKLRFEVFKLDASYITGLDQDDFDPWCHHLMVIERESGEVVGTYRVQTRAMAEAGIGWYTAGEFDLSTLPDEILWAAVETGRASVARDHRNGRVLNLLWRGLAAYLTHNHKRFLFGCCSLTSQDPNMARQTWDSLASGSFVHPKLKTAPLPGFECYTEDFEPDPNVTVKLPALFTSYLKLNAKIVGEPAIDRQFKTIDFLTLLDIGDLNLKAYRFYFK
jgi:putative hemolysin